MACLLIKSSHFFTLQSFSDISAAQTLSKRGLSSDQEKPILISQRLPSPHLTPSCMHSELMQPLHQGPAKVILQHQLHIPVHGHRRECTHPHFVMVDAGSGPSDGLSRPCQLLAAARPEVELHQQPSEGASSLVPIHEGA